MKFRRCLRAPMATRKRKSRFTRKTYFLTVKVARRPLFIGLLLTQRRVALSREGKPRTYVCDDSLRSFSCLVRVSTTVFYQDLETSLLQKMSDLIVEVGLEN